MHDECTGETSCLPVDVGDETVVEINDDVDGIGVDDESVSLCSLPSWYGWDKGPILFLRIREIDDTDGTLNLSQILSSRSFSRISQANMPGSLTL